MLSSRYLNLTQFLYFLDYTTETGLPGQAWQVDEHGSVSLVEGSVAEKQHVLQIGEGINIILGLFH